MLNVSMLLPLDRFSRGLPMSDDAANTQTCVHFSATITAADKQFGC